MLRCYAEVSRLLYLDYIHVAAAPLHSLSTVYQRWNGTARRRGLEGNESRLQFEHRRAREAQAHKCKGVGVVRSYVIPARAGWFHGVVAGFRETCFLDTKGFDSVYTDRVPWIDQCKCTYIYIYV